MPDLDPADWTKFAHDAHRALDLIIAHMRDLRQGPVWRQMPDEVRSGFDAPLPRQESQLDAVLDDFDARIRPYATGNGHPLFMGWVHGAGTPVGMVAEMLAAGLNANSGGRDHIGLVVERQIVAWARDLFSFPRDASGVLVTGTSMANLLGVLVARHDVLGEDGKVRGLRTAPAPLIAYASAEAHGCVAKAMEVSGLGTQALRLIATDATGALDCKALQEAIARDRRAGLRPFLVVGSAGTVNTGAIDRLDELADIAAREGLWFHVDGAFGALIALSPTLRPRLKGIEKANSIAFDFHKWAHVPYDAALLLVRDGKLHRDAFSKPAAYLARSAGGLGAGDLWPCDLGIDLSRGFRALKVWMTFQVLGADRIAAAIEENCRLAHLLAERLDASGLFETAAPVGLNIVCFALKGDESGAASEGIVTDLQRNGRAAPSLTRIDGRTLIRAAIVNHRCTEADIEDFLSALQAAALRHMLKRMAHQPTAEARQTA